MSKLKKFKLKYFHLCDFASISSDGKTNLLGIFEKIIVTNVPSQVPHIYIVFNLDTEQSNEDDFYLSIEDANKKELFAEKMSGKIEIPKGKSIANINGIVQINNLPIKNIGEYTVKLKCAGELLVKIKLLIEELKK